MTQEEKDEKIRKDLTTFLIEVFCRGKNTNFDRWTKSDCTSWIAWIEKKGKQKSNTDFSDLRTWKYIVATVLTEKDGIGQYLDESFTEEVAKKLQKRFGNVEQKQQSKSTPEGNYEEASPTLKEHYELDRRIMDAFRHSLEEFFSERAELISARKKPGWRLSPPM